MMIINRDALKFLVKGPDSNLRFPFCRELERVPGYEFFSANKMVAIPLNKSYKDVTQWLQIEFTKNDLAVKFMVSLGLWRTL